jgi:hypothetical protein
MQRLLCEHGCSDIVRGGPVRFRNPHKHAAHMELHRRQELAVETRRAVIAQTANLIRREK